MRNIGVVTVGRSDFGIYLPVLKRLSQTGGIRVRLFVGGAHLSPEFGYTVREVEQSGFEIAERIEMLLSSPTPGGGGHVARHRCCGVCAGPPAVST
jgi:hypothetical protein